MNRRQFLRAWLQWAFVSGPAWLVASRLGVGLALLAAVLPLTMRLPGWLNVLRVALIWVVVLWVLIGLFLAAFEVVRQLQATAAAREAELATELAETKRRLAEVSSTRTMLALGYSESEPRYHDTWEVGPSSGGPAWIRLHRVGVFNCGARPATNVEVKLSEIRPPHVAVPLPLRLAHQPTFPETAQYMGLQSALHRVFSLPVSDEPQLIDVVQKSDLEDHIHVLHTVQTVPADLDAGQPYAIKLTVTADNADPVSEWFEVACQAGEGLTMRVLTDGPAVAA